MIWGAIWVILFSTMIVEINFSLSFCRTKIYSYNGELYLNVSGIS